MTADWFSVAEGICMRCGGRCCTDDTQPPLTDSCYRRLVSAGVSPDSFETDGYRRLKLNGRACILFRDGKCSCHAIKPETCRAGPFTFDVRGDSIGIYLKTERICPLVRILKEDPDAYRQQYAHAATNIRYLVQALSEDELAAICRVDEPDTELVATIPRGARPVP